MKKKTLNIIIAICFPLLFVSCSKWLDVKPEDRFIEEELLKTEQGFADVLNGIYIDIGSSDMYGGILTMTTVDILAQYYAISSSQSSYRRNLASYTYTEENVQSAISGIWERQYTSILNVNKLLESLDTYGEHLPEQTANLFRGEAHALRALLYFDVLRMFAPNYTSDSTAVLIPYYDTPTNDISPYYSSTIIIEHIIRDLKTAEELLLPYDPAIDETTVDKTNGTVETGSRTWLTYRNYRLNYYAVKGLQARVYLYRGDKVSALASAEAVIGQKSKFPWTSRQAALETDFPNRIFSTEMLFGVENRSLYTQYNANFSPSLQDENILASGPNAVFLNTIFENQETDNRYQSSWDPNLGKPYPVFTKYRNLTNTANRNFRYTVPLIHIAEIFLIAAESEPDPVAGLAYLNELRENRNLTQITDPVELENGIFREYRKEFYGEGQLWFFYKRTEASEIYTATDRSFMSIANSRYTFPIPLSETEPR